MYVLDNMPVHLDPKVVWRVATKYLENPAKPKAQISRECDVSRHTVRNIISRIQADPDNINPMPQKHQRPKARKLSNAQIQELIDFSQSYPFASSSQIKRELNLNCSATTVMRRLKEAGITCHRPARKSRLSEHHKEERLKFAREHLPPYNWNDVLFTDEVTISTALDNGVQWVRRRRGERYKEANILQVRPRSGRVSVTIWGSISANGPVDIVKINGKLDTNQYMARILCRKVKPWIMVDQDNRVLQQDNAPCHTATRVKSYLANQQIKYLVWPACSPDLSPIENFWDLLKKEIGEQQFPGPSVSDKKAQLWTAIKEAFARFQQEPHISTVQNYYISMPQRMQAVITANGGHTRY